MFNLDLESVTLEPNSKWSEIKGQVSQDLTGQDVCDQTMALENNISLKVKTHIYGFDGLLVEVYEDSVIVKLTLFQ